MRIALILTTTAILLSVPALAAETTTPTPDNKDEVICRTMATNTGTRLGRSKECHTRREWDARRQDDRDMTEQTQIRDSRTPAPPGG